MSDDQHPITGGQLFEQMSADVRLGRYLRRTFAVAGLSFAVPALLFLLAALAVVGEISVGGAVTAAVLLVLGSFCLGGTFVAHLLVGRVLRRRLEDLKELEDERYRRDLIDEV